MAAEKEDIVISLATYNKRLTKIKKTFDTVIAQDVPYSKIVVNVQDDCTEEEFLEFKELEKKSDKVVVVKRPAKWRSFNKYLHVSKEYTDSVIITCDDDIFYENGFFKALCDEHVRNPSEIICHEVNPMLLKGKSRVEIFNSLDVKLRQKEFGKYMTGCCLFPKRCFERSKIRLDDYDRFMELTDGVHDEIWLWTLSTLLGIQCICLDYTFSFDLDGNAMKADEWSLCNINGNAENIRKYDERINSLYGKELCEVLSEKPCTFEVNRSNFMAVYGNMGWINYIFNGYNVEFVCNEDEINRSLLVNLVNAINRCKWFNKVNVIHGKLMGN